VVPAPQAHLVTASWSPFGAGGPRRCSFCSRREESVSHLVRSRDAYICDACVELAAEAIAAAPPDSKLVRIRRSPPVPKDRDAAEEEIERVFETAIGGEATDESDWNSSRAAQTCVPRCSKSGSVSLPVIAPTRSSSTSGSSARMKPRCTSCSCTPVGSQLLDFPRPDTRCSAPVAGRWRAKPGAGSWHRSASHVRRRLNRGNSWFQP
jgi:hypothetical protein